VGVLLCNDRCLCISGLFVGACLFVCLLVAGVLLLCALDVFCCCMQVQTILAHNNNTPATNKHTNKHSTTNKTLIHKHQSLQNNTPTYSHQLLRIVLQPAFGYHPTPAEPHQYTSTHPNRAVHPHTVTSS